MAEVFQGPARWGKRECWDCERGSNELEDGRCPDCNGTRDEQAYFARRDAAIARLRAEVEWNPKIMAARAEAVEALEKSRVLRRERTAGRAGR
jgi:hypothetical protein